MIEPIETDESDILVGWAVCRRPGGWHLGHDLAPLVMDLTTARTTAQFDRDYGAEAIVVPVFEEDESCPP